MDALYRGPDTDYSECRRGSRKMGSSGMNVGDRAGMSWEFFW